MYAGLSEGNHGCRCPSLKYFVLYACMLACQARMSTVSNQETFRATGTGGRLVCDVLRQVRRVVGLAVVGLGSSLCPVPCVSMMLERSLGSLHT